MDRLISINQITDIPPEYLQTPIAQLFEYHNLGHEYKQHANAELLIGMCMDNRKHLNVPDNFAYVLRAGGANLRHSEFKVSYAIAVGKVTHIALVGHTECGMSNLESRKDQFIQGMIETAGWKSEEAEQHFNYFSPIFEIGDEVDFVITEVERLRKTYPKILVAPMLYKVEDNRLYLINEKTEDEILSI